MASVSDEAGRPDMGGTGGRRDFMRKAAVVGSGAFLVPTIITVDPAEAQALTSPPPERPGRPESPPVDLGSSPGTVSPPASGQPGARAPGSRVTGRTELPRTGADLDRLLVPGLAATAGARRSCCGAPKQRPVAPRPLTPLPRRDRGGSRPGCRRSPPSVASPPSTRHSSLPTRCGRPGDGRDARPTFMRSAVRDERCSVDDAGLQVQHYDWTDMGMSEARRRET